jgi:uncharacterized protein involved in exopolysaccharide biosynthesis
VAQAYQTYALERQAKTQMETTNASVLLTAPVLIVDQAEPALRPCKPNKPLNLALGAGVGLVLGGLAAAFVGFLKPHFSR